MKRFLDTDFLLSTETARRLYHEAAAEEPIFDYHCHLNPEEIAGNRRFSNLSEIWLSGDHYKWRALRANGTPEELITGKGDPRDKFLAWADTVPRLIGNPLYHWTHLELQRYFDIHEPLGPANAGAVWETANKKLNDDPELSAWGILKKFKVTAIGTTDDPADTLECHQRIRQFNEEAANGKPPRAAIQTRVLPSFRPDVVLAIDSPEFISYLERLGAAAKKTIRHLDDLLEALKDRVNFFDALGCAASDHSLSYPLHSVPPEGKLENAAVRAFDKRLADQPLEAGEADYYRTFVLRFLGAQYAEKNWGMQIHLAAFRNANSRMLAALGPNTGYDAILDYRVSENLGGFLDFLESRGTLPKTILYSLNPKDYYPMLSIMGSFQGSGPGKTAIPGKMQLGSAWWFCDSRDGMEEQLRSLGNLGLLSRFVGMLTDSRSFLSYPRHEYFRRILCALIGRWAEEGEITQDMELLKNMVRDISYRNAEQYFSKA
jgi:glucuronate isomerase